MRSVSAVPQQPAATHSSFNLFNPFLSIKNNTMQFNIQFSILCIAAVSTLTSLVNAVAVPTTHLLTVDEMNAWLARTDANVTYIGKQPAIVNGKRELSKRDTTVAYCTNQAVDVCGGTCVTYTGGATCLDTPGTACLAATTNVGFCDRGECGGSCNQYSSCGSRLDGGFCATPGTASINVPASFP